MANNYPNFNPYNQYQQNWIDTYKAYQARITSIRGELSSVVITQENRQNLQVGLLEAEYVQRKHFDFATYNTELIPLYDKFWRKSMGSDSIDFTFLRW